MSLKSLLTAFYQRLLAIVATHCWIIRKRLVLFEIERLALKPMRFFGKQNGRTLLEINDLSAAVLAGDGQTRFTKGKGFGNFFQYFLRGIVGFT